MTAAKALATAAAQENLFVQAFPEFGVERRGAPVCAYLRVSDQWIYERGRIETPDHVLILDTTLVEEGIDITQGIKPDGWMVFNSDATPAELRRTFNGFPVASAPGNAIAINHQLGSKYAPFVNFPMLGAFIRVIPVVKLQTLKEIIHDFAPSRKDANVQAAVDAYDTVQLSATGTSLEKETLWAEK